MSLREIDMIIIAYNQSNQVGISYTIDKRLISIPYINEQIIQFPLALLSIQSVLLAVGI